MSGLGYSVGRNKPYAGGFITEHYGNPASGLHTIQLELNRAIYMDERRRERSAAVCAGDRRFRRAGRRAGRGSARRSRAVPGGGGVDVSASSFRSAREAGESGISRFPDAQLRIRGSSLRTHPGMTGCIPKRKKGRLNEQAAQV